MPALIFDEVSFAHGDQSPILASVSFRLADGVCGVVGENGAGKTTLLRLAAFELAPERGSVRVTPEDARIVYCPQDVHVLGDDVHRFADAADGEAHALRDLLALERGGIARWSTLSPGERRRWQLGTAIHGAPDVLLADEPTNHLDAPGRARVIAALRRLQGVALLVSHDRALLDAVAPRTLRLRRTQAQLTELPYSRARDSWELEARALAADREARKTEHEAARRRLAQARDVRARAERMRSSRERMRDAHDHDARSAGAKFLADRAERRLGRVVSARKSDLERAAAAIPEADATREVGRSIFIGYEPSPRPYPLRLDIDELRAGTRRLLRDVHLALGRSARVHVEGPNGAGKTTLVHALLAGATLPPDKLLYVPQEIEPVDAKTWLDQVRALPPDVRGRTLSLVAALGLAPSRLLASRAPSPGEARKLAIALGLGRRVWALVLDEPTNHLDLPSIERLEAALSGYPGALLIVSHDAALAARLTTERWTLRGERVEVASTGIR